MVEFIYGVLGFITGTAFVGFLIYGIANFIMRFNTKYGISYEAKKQKLIQDQLEDIFGGYFIEFKKRDKILTLSKEILKNDGTMLLKYGVENVKNLYFPASPIYCYETNENILVIFSYKMELMEINFSTLL